jgi:hypothetical protein
MKVAAADTLGNDVWSASSMLTARSRVISTSAFLDKQSEIGELPHLALLRPNGDSVSTEKHPDHWCLGEGVGS